jgi:hypothetical protein
MRLKIVLALAAFAVIAAYAGTAWASPITVPNFSFESNVVADGKSNGTVNGWTLGLGKGLGAYESPTYNPTSADFTPAGGNGTLPGTAASSQCMYNVYAGQTTENYTSSNLFTLQAHQKITITVAVGNTLWNPWLGGEIGLLDAPGYLNWMQKFAYCSAEPWLQAYGGTSNWSSSDNTLSWSGGNGNIPAGTFADATVIIYSDLIIGNYLFNYNGNVLTSTKIKAGDGMALYLQQEQYLCYDNVRLDVVNNFVMTPEPSTFMLFAAGAVGMLAYFWPRRRK